MVTEMVRDRVQATYVILVGVVMIGFWTMLYVREQIPELSTAPYEIGYHLVAELVTAIALVGAGIGLVRGHGWSQRLYPVALGMLLYTVVNSAGYYAQLGDIAMVGMFTVLTVTTLVLLVEYVVTGARTAKADGGRTGCHDA